VGIIAHQGYDAHEDADLVAHSLAHLLPQNETYVAWRKGQYLTAAQQDLIDLLTRDVLED
jgi:hypothetical protein